MRCASARKRWKRRIRCSVFGPYPTASANRRRSCRSPMPGARRSAAARTSAVGRVARARSSLPPSARARVSVGRSRRPRPRSPRLRRPRRLRAARTGQQLRRREPERRSRGADPEPDAERRARARSPSWPGSPARPRSAGAGPDDVHAGVGQDPPRRSRAPSRVHRQATCGPVVWSSWYTPSAYALISANCGMGGEVEGAARIRGPWRFLHPHRCIRRQAGAFSSHRKEKAPGTADPAQTQPPYPAAVCARPAAAAATAARHSGTSPARVRRSTRSSTVSASSCRTAHSSSARRSTAGRAARAARAAVGERDDRAAPRRRSGARAAPARRPARGAGADERQPTQRQAGGHGTGARRCGRRRPAPSAR